MSLAFCFQTKLKKSQPHAYINFSPQFWMDAFDDAFSLFLFLHHFLKSPPGKSIAGSTEKIIGFF